MNNLIPVLFFLATQNLTSQWHANYQEDSVPDYDLPEILVDNKGNKINTIKEWESKRRAEIIEQFAGEVYGRVPDKKIRIETRLTEKGIALEGKAFRKQVKMVFYNGDDSLDMDILLYTPTKTEEYPVFLGMNFYGNHTIHEDEKIKITDSWVRNNENFSINGNMAKVASRGVRSHRWPLEQIIDRGYGLATLYYGDIDPDFDDRFKNGIHPLFYKKKQKKPENDEWGSINAWAWGLSRAMDYLETEPDVDNNQVVVMGHSRLGKAALWAGARDERFALVISNESGCGGAALSRRQYGETVERINDAFPHWFCKNFHKYGKNVNKLPVDQHMLIALMPPRPVYVASAQGDHWADPKGEFLSALYAGKVYELYGKKGLPVNEMPPVNTPLNKTSVGYHIRTGNHDITLYDWMQYLDFADLHFGKEK
ncbi:MAG: acetylxylan esterase [Bacteroidales bacterium]